MKILFKCFVALVLSTSILSCSSDRINGDLNTIKPLIKKFTLEKTEVSVHTNSSERIRITSGNDKYSISNASGHGFASVEVDSDGKSLIIKGVKKGKATVVVTDEISKESITININVLHPVTPEEFKLDKTDISVYTNASELIKIISGNGDYSISNVVGKEFATVEIGGDNKSLVIKGLKKGNASLVITDDVSKKSFTIKIKVVIPIIPHQSKFATINFQETNRDVIIRAGNESIKKYKQYLSELEKLPELPISKANYNNQRGAWETSKKLAPSYEENFIRDSKNPNIKIKDLITPLYENILIYGEGFTLIELLARKSEEFSKQYPDNQEIKNFIQSTFDGGYSSQDGNDFTLGLNNDIDKYNKIVDLVNKLNQQ